MSIKATPGSSASKASNDRIASIVSCVIACLTCMNRGANQIASIAIKAVTAMASLQRRRVRAAAAFL